MLTIYIFVFLSATINLLCGSKFCSFTLRRANLLKAILPLGIIVGHACQYNPEISFIIKDFSVTGSLIVGVFFFISGYGLQYKRMQGKETTGVGYVCNKLKKMLVPCILPSITYWIVSWILGDNNGGLSLSYILRAHYFFLPFSWFVPILIILTVIYEMLSANVNRNFHLCLISILILFAYLMYQMGQPSYMYKDVLCFFLGSFICLNENYIREKNKWLILCFGGMLLLVSSCNWELWINNRTLCGVLGLVLLYALIDKLPQGKIIEYLQMVSYDIYLWQGLSFLILGQFSLGIYLFILMSAVLTIVFTLPIYYLRKRFCLF